MSDGIIAARVLPVVPCSRFAPVRTGYWVTASAGECSWPQRPDRTAGGIARAPARAGTRFHTTPLARGRATVRHYRRKEDQPGSGCGAHPARPPSSGPSMSVYVDDAIWNWQGLKWAHLLADDTDELHRFALQLGIHRASYQGPPRTPVPHYDVTSYERRRAIAQGAIACTREEIVIVLRRLRSAGVGRAGRFIR